MYIWTENQNVCFQKKEEKESDFIQLTWKSACRRISKPFWDPAMQMIIGKIYKRQLTFLKIRDMTIEMIVIKQQLFKFRQRGQGHRDIAHELVISQVELGEVVEPIESISLNLPMKLVVGQENLSHPTKLSEIRERTLQAVVSEAYTDQRRQSS